ncbi:single-pass membrane and coiled-coil domain-containing protein 2 isoform X2 [Ochotona princeps]|uniref:single-pass membrane and coiled-coil domain-containing protein 2 isoform X2 n=1 Tax=Ochotona princeps TaxID=9978 RepID=UPI002714E25B|nr:single-pass membrane and coiled-coil domain-containing protein 2 isoform X2 [Ochotona princeps]
MSPWRQTDVKEQLLFDKNECFLQQQDKTESALSSLKETIQTDQSLGRSEEKDNEFSENPPMDALPAGSTETRGMAELRTEPEPEQPPQRGPDEQEVDLAPEDPRTSTSLQLSENIPELSRENMFRQLNYWNAKMSLQVKELGADHVDWMEKMNSILQITSITESTVKSLLKEVKFLEGQTEKMEDQDFDPDQGANIEAKITEIRKQLEEMDKKFAQGDACHEAHDLKEKLTGGIELVALFSQNFCKDMTLLNSRLGMYHQLQEEKTDSESSGEMTVEESEPQVPEALPAAAVRSTPPPVTAWKWALQIFIMFYVFAFTGILCYILLFDATFIFERVLPMVLGRHTLWELREVITPFLNLEVEDLLPS